MKIKNLMVIILVVALVASCSKGDESEKAGKEMKQEMNIKLVNGSKEKDLKIDAAKYPVATIELESGDKIELVLLPEVAPNTVNNFIDLIQKGYYDGLIFHRVINGFMIQGGCPEGTGMGTPGYSIKDEFVMEDGYMLPHLPGVISMAKRQQPHTAGSQFFIVHKDASFLNGSYASFGVVKNKESMAVVDKIANTKTGANDKPLEDVVMKKVTVQLNGYEPKEVEKVK